jgi:hypothetical protein
MLGVLGPMYFGVMALFALLALWGVMRAVVKLRRGEPVGAVMRLLLGSVFALVALMMLSVGANLRTYQRLTYEAPAATLAFRKVSDRYWSVELETQDGAYRALDLRGDEWQLDARIIKWHGLGVVLGLDTLWRLERMSGRYRDLEAERSAPRTVHGLSGPAPGLDLWLVAQGGWLPLVDASYGSSVYLPAAEGARYEVKVSASGLVARPLNEAATAAIAAWPSP